MLLIEGDKKNKVSLKTTILCEVQPPLCLQFWMSGSQNQQSLCYGVALSHADGMQRMCRYVPSCSSANQREIALVSDATITVVQSFSYCLEGESSWRKGGVSHVDTGSADLGGKKKISHQDLQPKQRGMGRSEYREGMTSRKGCARSRVFSPHLRSPQGWPDPTRWWLTWEMHGEGSALVPDCWNTIGDGGTRGKEKGRPWNGASLHGLPLPHRNAGRGCQAFSVFRRTQKSRFLCD